MIKGWGQRHAGIRRRIFSRGLRIATHAMPNKDKYTQTNIKKTRPKTKTKFWYPEEDILKGFAQCDTCQARYRGRLWRFQPGIYYGFNTMLNKMWMKVKKTLPDLFERSYDTIDKKMGKFPNASLVMFDNFDQKVHILNLCSFGKWWKMNLQFHRMEKDIFLRITLLHSLCRDVYLYEWRMLRGQNDY